MATQPALMPIEQDLRTSYSPGVDFVDGVIEERNLGEFGHGRLTGLFFALCHSKGKALRIDPIVEQRIRVSPTRVRLCDFVLVDAKHPPEHVTQTPPLLCVEILSPEDRLPARTPVLRTTFIGASATPGF